MKNDNLPAWTARSRNLVHFQRHLTPEQLHEAFAADYGFRAEGSRFSVLKQHGTAPGPDDCFAHIQIDARPVFRKLLGLEVDYPGAAPGALTLYTSRNHYRSHIEELFHHCAAQGRPFPPVRGRCVIYYSATDVLQIVYELRNHAAAPVALRLRWFSEPAAGRASKTKAHRQGFRHTAVQTVINGEYRVSAELTGAVFHRDGDRLITAWHDVTVPANGVRTFTFTVRFNDARTRSGSLATAVRHVEQHLAALPALPREWRRFEPVVLRAAGIVLTNRYTERTGARTVHSGKTGVEAVWFWDTPTNVLGLGLLGDAATGWNSLRLLCAGIAADGKPAGTYCDGVYNRENVQNPILAWGVWNFHQLCPDPRALRACYPALVRYVNWWRTHRDSNGNGLYEWPPGCCTGLDDAMSWHSGSPIALRPGEDWATRDWGHSQTNRFEGVDWNTQLHLELRALASIARVLGRSREATAWGQAARDLGRRIHRELFNPAAGMYQARCIDDNRFNELVSLESFLPLYAGLTPRPLARQICRKFLLNPDRFYSVLPFPTLDLRHEAFRSGGELYEPPAHPGSLCQRAYWIGRTWLNYSYWMVGALEQSGLRRAADAATEKILDAVSRHETIYESYDPLTGAGNGHPEFTWGASAVLALAFRLYRRGPLFNERKD